MAGGGKPASYLVLMFVTILFISLASFIFISTTRHGGDNKAVINAATYGELVNYVKRLEVAVLQKQKHLGNTAGINTEHPPESLHEVAGHAPPKFDGIETGTSAAVSQTASTPFSSTLDESITKQWLSQLSAKLLCLRLKSGGIYLYHTRKAAGTSIRDILAYMAAEWHVPYYETEGIVLDRRILDKNGLLSVTSLRDPVARVMSLYWYEHVGWYDGVLKQTERCKSLKEWVAAWRDGSRWKADFMAKNPDSVYVEIENYYVKMLSGRHAGGTTTGGSIGSGSAARKVTAQDLEVAKEVLRSFDLVLLSDWMGDATQIEAMNAIFPGRNSMTAGHKVRGDHNARVKLTERLAPDEEEIRKILAEINKYDIELFEYAQSLMAYRLKFMAPTVLSVKAGLGMDSHLNTVVSQEVFNKHHAQCAALDATLSPELKKHVGIFQPPGHKGPF